MISHQKLRGHTEVLDGPRSELDVPKVFVHRYVSALGAGGEVFGDLMIGVTCGIT